MDSGGGSAPSWWAQLQGFFYQNEEDLSGALFDRAFGASKVTVERHTDLVISIPKEIEGVRDSVKKGDTSPELGNQSIYGLNKNLKYSTDFIIANPPLGYAEHVAEKELFEKALEDNTVPSFKELFTEPSSDIPNSKTNIRDFTGRRTIYAFFGMERSTQESVVVAKGGVRELPVVMRPRTDSGDSPLFGGDTSLTLWGDDYR